MADERDAFPPAPTPPPSAHDVATAAVTELMAKQKADADRRIADSEVVDPDRQKTPLERAEERDAPARPSKPDLVPGASTSESIPADLHDRALALDISAEEIAQTPPSVLRKYVAKLERQQPPQQPAFSPVQEQRPEEESWTPPPLTAVTEGIEFDEGLGQAFSERDKVTKKLLDEQAALKRQLAEQQAREQARETAAGHKEFERLIAADEDLHEVLGDDKGVPKDPHHLGNRQKAWSRITSLVNQFGYTIEDAYQEVRHGLFHKQLSEKGGAKVAAKLEAHGKTFTRPPSGTKGKGLPFGRERAIQALEDAQSKR